MIQHGVLQGQDGKFRPMSRNTSIDQVSTNINSHSGSVNIFQLKFISNMLENWVRVNTPSLGVARRVA